MQNLTKDDNIDLVNELRFIEDRIKSKHCERQETI